MGFRVLRMWVHRFQIPFTAFGCALILLNSVAITMENPAIDPGGLA